MTSRNIKLYHHVKNEDKIKKFKHIEMLTERSNRLLAEASSARRIAKIETCREYANIFFDCLNNNIKSVENCGKQYYILNECIKDIS